MSLKLWCPDCNTQTIVDMMSVYDGYEFACDDCKRVFYVRIERGLTPLALDGRTRVHNCDTCQCEICTAARASQTARQ